LVLNLVYTERRGETGTGGDCAKSDSFWGNNKNWGGEKKDSGRNTMKDGNPKGLFLAFRAEQGGKDPGERVKGGGKKKSNETCEREIAKRNCSNRSFCWGERGNGCF